MADRSIAPLFTWRTALVTALPLAQDDGSAYSFLLDQLTAEVAA